MVSRWISPDYFSRVAMTIIAFDWKHEKSYSFFFSKVKILFDYTDEKEWNELRKEFHKKFLIDPVDIDPIMNRIFETRKKIIVHLEDGSKKVLTYKLLHQEIEEIKQWCYRKLNAYFKEYGIIIDSFTDSDIATVPKM